MPPKKIESKHEKAIHSKTALLLIDIQSGFHLPEYFGTARNNPKLEENVLFLLTKIREYAKRADKLFHVEIIHIHHHSTNPNSPLHPDFILPDDNSVRGVDPLPCATVMEGETVFTKSVNSAFIGTKLERHLRERGIRQLLICGLTTDHCVSTTVRMAANLGVIDENKVLPQRNLLPPPWSGKQGKIFLLEDACATFGKGDFTAEVIHRVHVESLRDEFAEISTVDETITKILAGKKEVKVNDQHRANFRSQVYDSSSFPHELAPGYEPDYETCPSSPISDLASATAGPSSVLRSAFEDAQHSPEFVSVFGNR